MEFSYQSPCKNLAMQKLSELSRQLVYTGYWHKTARVLPAMYLRTTPTKLSELPGVPEILEGRGASAGQCTISGSSPTDDSASRAMFTLLGVQMYRLVSSYRTLQINKRKMATADNVRLWLSLSSLSHCCFAVRDRRIQH